MEQFKIERDGIILVLRTVEEVPEPTVQENLIDRLENWKFIRSIERENKKRKIS